ncbi:methyl-accepting chemotaxis protein [Vibrio sp. SCSIO 43132]|uniref:methyl-accepting chemotaxis protein n=1 Tax=Vibrio TaxID=662 RepID=UPI001CA873B8|nr:MULTISPECIES: methyl-accepting chemotaxis protein [Vibrio]UAB72624.1 methyl-accepting chemotaxis protein [Vibrio sp. SCSIO 43132]BDU40367.1 methyl-accepting chemotaxis protein [Vibrio nigripulchritudo]BDU46103.1 methyl-accepting chemotaxis protein [Vibrio nigripulchritudo]
MRLGFKTRINISVVLLVAVSLSVLATISIINLKKEMTSGLQSITQQKLNSHVKEIEVDMESKIRTIHQGALHFTNELSDQENIDRVLLLTETSKISAVMIAYKDGRNYMSDDGGIKEETDRYLTRPWFTETAQKGRTITSDIYQDIVTKKQVISISAPVYQNGELIAVLIGDVRLDHIVEQVGSMRFAGGAATLSDRNHKFFASDDPTDIGKTPSQVSPSFQVIENGFRSGQSGLVHFPYLGIDFDGYFQRIRIDSENYWTLMVFVDRNTALTEVNSAIKESILVGFLLLAVSTVIIFVVISQLFRPLDKLKAAVLDLSNGNGDLTARLKVEQNDDLGQISEGFNKFVSNLQRMIGDIADSSVQISKDIRTLTSSASQNEQMLLSHSSETEQVVTSITEMSESARSVAESVQQSSQVTEATSVEAHNSKGIVNNAVETVRSLVDEVEEMAERIQVMNTDANQISAVLSVIGDISEQTNLLALNAAIEAARAGEQGRGFAVVADEVRALAARTQNSTTEISDMLTRLLDGTEKVVNAMENTKSRCQITAEKTSEVSGSLDVVSNSVNQIDDISSQIATATEEQSAVSEEISRNMLAIRDIVESLVNSGRDTVNVTQSLSNSNSQLEKLVAQFKVQ